MTEREMLQEYANARASVDQYNDKLKEAKAWKDRTERTIIDALISKEATATAKYEGLGALSLKKPEVKAACLVANKDDLHEFLRENNYGDLIRETVHYTDLNKFVAAMLEDGTEYPEYITYIMHQGVVFRGVK